MGCNRYFFLRSNQFVIVVIGFFLVCWCEVFYHYIQRLCHARCYCSVRPPCSWKCAAAPSFASYQLLYHVPRVCRCCCVAILFPRLYLCFLKVASYFIFSYKYWSFLVSRKLLSCRVRWYRLRIAFIFVVPSIMLYSSEISPTRSNNCVFILRNGFTLHVLGDNLTHHQEYIYCIWPQVSRFT